MEAMKMQKEEVEAFLHGKIGQVPNAKKNATGFIVRYDKIKDVLFPEGKIVIHSELCKKFPGVADARKLLKASVSRDNGTNYRLNLNDNRKNPGLQKQPTTSSINSHHSSARNDTNSVGRSALLGATKNNDDEDSGTFFTPAGHDGDGSHIMSLSTLLSDCYLKRLL